MSGCLRVCTGVSLGLAALALLSSSAVAQVATQPAQPVLGSMPEERIIESASAVLKEALSTPGQGIPRSMLADAQGVVIVPRLLKIGLVAGVRHGKGVLIARDAQGNWEAPLFVTMTGGSLGWQVGIASSDVVLVFKNRGRVDQLKKGKFTIGVDAAAAAGPVGRRVEAGTDAKLSAEIYSYARTRGLFAGVSIDGAALQIDHAATQAYYASGKVPTSALTLLGLLHSVSTPAVGAPAAGAAAGAGQVVQPAPATSSAVVSVETRRLEFVTRWKTLSALLDEAWQRYLGPPAALVQPGQTFGLEEVQALLRRYDRVQSDPQYQVLTQRSEFQAAHESLRKFVELLQAQSSSSDKLHLPAPPSQ